MSVITLDEISWRWKQPLLYPGAVDRMVVPSALGTTAALSCHYCQSPADKDDAFRTALQSEIVLGDPHGCHLKDS